MMKNKCCKIGILGFGTMGQALSRVLAKSRDFRVSAYDIAKDKKIRIKGVSLSDGACELINNSDIFIVAIKPQDIAAFLREHASAIISKRLLVITIAAGIPLKWYKKYLRKTPVIRVMPNIGLLSGASTSFMCGNKNVTGSHLALSRKIFSLCGTVYLTDEKWLDKATSITASGPGYVFFFMNSIFKAAVSLGFSKTQARRMTIETFKAAQIFSENSTNSFEDLIKAVASKKGTTQAALEYFYESKIEEKINEAVKAAFLRSKEISRGENG